MSGRRLQILAVSGLLALAGCTGLGQGSDVGRSGFPDPIPEAVIALAAPYQNTDAVVFRPEDNCYWYWHDGPVEATLLPLRTVRGAPICRVVGPAGA